MARSSKAKGAAQALAQPDLDFKTLTGAIPTLEEVGVEPGAAEGLKPLSTGAALGKAAGQTLVEQTAGPLATGAELLGLPQAEGLRATQEAATEQIGQVMETNPVAGFVGAAGGGLISPLSLIPGVAGAKAASASLKALKVLQGGGLRNLAARELATNLGFSLGAGTAVHGRLPTPGQLALEGVTGAALGLAGHGIASRLPAKARPVQIDRSSTWTTDISQATPALADPGAPLLKEGWTVGSTRRGWGHDQAKGRHPEAPGGHSVVDEAGRSLAIDLTPPGGMTPQNVSAGYARLRKQYGPEVPILIEADHFHVGLTEHGRDYVYDNRGRGRIVLAKKTEALAGYGKGRRPEPPVKADAQADAMKAEAAFEQPHPGLPEAEAASIAAEDEGLRLIAKEDVDQAGTLLAARNARVRALNQAAEQAMEVQRARAGEGISPLPQSEPSQMELPGMGEASAEAQTAMAEAAPSGQAAIPGLEPGRYVIPAIHPVMPLREGAVAPVPQSLSGVQLKFGNDVDQALYEVGRQTRTVQDPQTGARVLVAGSDQRQQDLGQFLQQHFPTETDQEILQHAVNVAVGVEKRTAAKLAQPKGAAKAGDFSQTVLNRGQLPAQGSPLGGTKSEIMVAIQERMTEAQQAFSGQLKEAGADQRVREAFRSGQTDEQIAESLGYGGQEMEAGSAMVRAHREAEGVPQPTNRKKFNAYLSNLAKDPETARVPVFGEGIPYLEFLKSPEHATVTSPEFVQVAGRYAGLDAAGQQTLEASRSKAASNAQDVPALMDYLTQLEGVLRDTGVTVTLSPEQKTVTKALVSAIQDAAVQQGLMTEGLGLPWRNPSVLFEAVTRYMQRSPVVRGITQEQAAAFDTQLRQFAANVLEGAVPEEALASIRPIFHELVRDIQFANEPFVGLQGPVGSFDPRTGAIRLHEEAPPTAAVHEIFHAVTLERPELTGYMQEVAGLSAEDRAWLAWASGSSMADPAYVVSTPETAARLMQIWALDPAALSQANPDLAAVAEAAYHRLPEDLQRTITILGVAEQAQTVIGNAGLDPGNRLLTAMAEQAIKYPAEAQGLEGLTTAYGEAYSRSALGSALSKERAYNATILGYNIPLRQAAWDAVSSLAEQSRRAERSPTVAAAVGGEAPLPTVLYYAPESATNILEMSPANAQRRAAWEKALSSPRAMFSSSTRLLSFLWNKGQNVAYRVNMRDAAGELINPHLAGAVNAAERMEGAVNQMAAELISPLMQSPELQAAMQTAGTSLKEWAQGQVKARLKPEHETALRRLLDEWRDTGKVPTQAVLEKEDAGTRALWEMISEGYQTMSGMMRVGGMDTQFRITTAFRDLAGKSYTPELFLSDIQSGKIQAQDVKGQRDLDRLEDAANSIISTFKPGWSSQVRTGDRIIMATAKDGTKLSAEGAYGRREGKRIKAELRAAHPGATISEHIKGPYLPPLEKAGSPDTVLELARILQEHHGDGTPLTAEEALGIASRFDRRAPMANLRRRENVPGYEKDSVIQTYLEAVHRVGHYVYGSQFRDEISDLKRAFGKDKSRAADLDNFFNQATFRAGWAEEKIEEGIKFVNEQLAETGWQLPSFQEAARSLRKFTRAATLGFGNLRVIAFNVTHGLTVTGPETLIEASHLAKQGGRSMGLYAEKATFGAAADAAKILLGLDRSSEGYAAFVKAIEDRQLLPSHFDPRSGPGNWGQGFLAHLKAREWKPTNNDTVFGGFSRLLDSLNRQTDYSRQLMTFLAFRRMARELGGYGADEATAYAIRHTNGTLDLRPRNRPTWGFSSGELGNSVFQFRDFMHNQLRLVSDAVKHAGGTIMELPSGEKVKVQTVRPLLYALGAMGVTAGVGGIFPIGLGIAAYNHFADADLGADIRRGVRDRAGKVLPSWLADGLASVADEGVFGAAFGMNFEETGSLMLPNGKKGVYEALMPVAVQIMAQRVSGAAKAPFSEDPTLSAFKAIFPNSFTHIAELAKLAHDDWKLYDQKGALIGKLGYLDHFRVALSGYGFAKREAYRLAHADKRVQEIYHEGRRDMAQDIAERMAAHKPLELEHWHFLQTTPTASRMVRNATRRISTPRAESILTSISRTRDAELRQERLRAYAAFLGTAEVNELEDTFGMDLNENEDIGAEEETDNAP